MDGLLDITACQGRVDPVLCFRLLTIGVCQFADEIRRIETFLPRLGNVGSNYLSSAFRPPSSTPNLPGTTCRFFIFDKSAVGVNENGTRMSF